VKCRWKDVELEDPGTQVCTFMDTIMAESSWSEGNTHMRGRKDKGVYMYTHIYVCTSR